MAAEFSYHGSTPKHVDLHVWKELNIKAKQAFADWKKANPDSVLDDNEFWMIAEAWGHGIDRSEFADNGFDGAINFAFQGDDSSSALSCFAKIEPVYERYASTINSVKDFTVMNYLSSHDTLIYFDAVSRSKKCHKNAGAALLLAPGVAQIYYGDESGRSYSETGSDIVAGTRSDMNWAQIEKGKHKSISEFWSKVGQFRNRHIAVGAGNHQKLSDEPYAFARSYHEDGIKDDVVVVYVGKKKKR